MGPLLLFACGGCGYALSHIFYGKLRGNNNLYTSTYLRVNAQFESDIEDRVTSPSVLRSLLIAENTPRAFHTLEGQFLARFVLY